MLIGHRGAAAQAPENTAAAIRAALASGVEMIEMDVQLTRDRRLVVFHDARLDRTTNGTGWLSHWRYRALAGLDCGSWFSPRFANERLLLLSEAVRMIPSPTLINLELKATRHERFVVQRVVRCVRWTRVARRVLVSSFSSSLLARVQRMQPRLARALICRKYPALALRQARALGCVALHPHQSLASAAVIAQVHRHGLRVHVWTVDRPAEARRLWRLGVDGIFTNAPARLAPTLAQADP